MLQQLKFKTSEQNVFFTSDLHYCHSKLLESRGFSNIDEHNRFIIEEWNKKVDYNSIVFMLGDFVLGAGQKSDEVYKNLIDRLAFKELYLMPGNHFAGGKTLWRNAFLDEKIDEYYRLLVKLFHGNVYFIPNYYEIFVNSVPFVLSHFPIASYNGQAANSVHAHGHCHGSLMKHEWFKNNYYQGRVLDVSWENFKAPISFNEVMEIVGKKEPITFDHH
jgi:calcineurin-like phosphoesterase family protein